MRAKGEDSIAKHQSGRWMARLTVGVTEKGNPKRITVYADTQAKAREALLTLQQRHRRGDFANPTMLTVAQHLRDWLAMKESELKRSTYHSYSDLIENHIVPHIGHIRLTELQPTHVRHLHRAMARTPKHEGKKTLKPRTVRQAHLVLRGALQAALEDEQLMRNVASIVKAPKLDHFEPTLWTPGDIKKFLEGIQGHSLYAFYYLAITTGMRRGELIGLPWRAIDWKNGRLQIQQHLVQVDGKLYLETPKTHKSRRTIYLTSEAMGVLRGHRLSQRAVTSDLDPDLVFCGRTGSHLVPSNILRGFKTLCRQAGVPEIRFHDLRHVYASLAIRQGVPAKVLSEQLGHATPSFTLTVYAHLFSDQRRDAALTLGQLLQDPAGREAIPLVPREQTG